jgi:ribonuclease HI
MVLQIYTDGGSKGNPGPASVGVAYFINGTKIDTYREDIGHATNNEAEYTALIRALERVESHKVHKVHKVDSIQVFSDSRLMVNQVNGAWKIKESRIRDFIFKIRSLEAEIGLPISYKDIPREQNTVADDLVNNKV